MWTPIKLRKGGDVSFVGEAEGAGGGSQTVEMLDLGVVRVEDVVRAGSLVLVERAAGRFISSVRFGTDNYEAPESGLWIITQLTAGGSGFGVFGAGPAPQDTLGLTGTGGGIGPAGSAGPAQVLDPGPLVAGSQGPGGQLTGGLQEFLPPLAWQAGMPLALSQWVIDSNDHVQFVVGNGVTGGSAPVWDDSGSTTSDGTVTWQDAGPVPTVGSVHVYAEVVELGTPLPPYPVSIEFVQQPTDAAADATIAPPVTVRILDQHGDPYTDMAGALTVGVAILGAGTLSGTTFTQPVDGVATFDDLSIAEADSGYRLIAYLYPTVLIDTVTSDPFDITAP